MRKFLFLLMLWCFTGVSFGQVLVKGKLIDQITQTPASQITVMIGSMQSKTNEQGIFSFSLPEGMFTLTINSDYYRPISKVIQVLSPSTELEPIILSRNIPTQADNSGIAEVNLNPGDFESSRDAQNVSGLLHSANDIFISTAGFGFSSASFRMRGYDSEFQSVYLSGMLMNDAENGRPTWSEWGGLNDAVRNREYVNGIEPALFSFGNLGGATNMNTRASTIRKQHKVSYAFANRSYNNRLMYTYGTGLMDNNWAFATSISHRWAMEGNVEGTFYDAWSYYFGAEKKINDYHSIALSVLSAPYRRGMLAPAVQEAYDLTGDNHYNPNWGYLNGEKRNAKIRKANEPKIILNHFWTPDKNTAVTSTIGTSFGRYGTTSMNWYNAADPRPDYYRYLPGYQTESNVIDAVTEAWKSDPSVSQINWDRMYQVNYLANQQNTGANYSIEERRDDHFKMFGSSNIRHELNDNIQLSGGLELQSFTGYHFKTLNDLLGGNYWVDVDQFAQRDFVGDTTKLINDLNSPYQKIYEGDKFGYNYKTHINSGNVWAMAKFNFNKVESYISLNGSHTTLWREGLMKNGRYPDNSLGNSEKFSYLNYGIKAGATYKLSGRNYFYGNAGYITKAPYINSIFTSPRISNKTYDTENDESVLSGDINYIHKGTFANIRITAYHTIFNNQTEVIGFYHDDFATFVNMILSDVDKVHQGVEIGTDIKLSKTLSLIAVANIGNYIYTSRPTSTVSFENGSRADTTRTVYSKYFFVNGTPQNAGSLGLKYFHPKFWFFDLSVNYFDKIYLDFNPERRTQLAIANLGPGDPLIEEITVQEKLKSGYTVDMSIGKSWIIKGYNVGLNFNINNVLDNQTLITGGFEQMRFDFVDKNLNKFPPKYFYSFGRTYFLMLSVRI